MALFTFWYGQDFVIPKKIDGLSIYKEFEVANLVPLMQLDEQNIENRFRDGNEAWVVRLDNKLVSFGWLSRGRVRIGELSKEIVIPKGNAYLWNFRTLEPYRGRGYYAQLLSTILVSEEKVNERMWIISAPENLSSYYGIVKVGFKPVGDIMFDYQNEVVLLSNSVDQRTQAGADLFQIPTAATAVRPCWRCASKAMKKEASCDCYENQLPCCCNNNHYLTTMNIQNPN